MQDTSEFGSRKQWRRSFYRMFAQAAIRAFVVATATSKALFGDFLRPLYTGGNNFWIRLVTISDKCPKRLCVIPDNEPAKRTHRESLTPIDIDRMLQSWPPMRSVHVDCRLTANALAAPRGSARNAVKKNTLASQQPIILSTAFRTHQALSTWMPGTVLPAFSFDC
jgi:hypothetical protein